MKTKTFMLAVLLAAAAGAQAQYSADYYHRTGDTVYTRSEIGFYNWWDFEQMLRLRESIVVGCAYFSPVPQVVITPYLTTAPIRIVGIAGCLQDSQWSGPVLPEYFYLFDAGEEGPVYIDRSQIHFRDSTPHRYLHLNLNTLPTGNRDSCCFDAPNFAVFDLYECYFDTAYTLTDSFYVGWSYNNPINGLGQIYYFAAMRANDIYQLEPC